MELLEPVDTLARVARRIEAETGLRFGATRRLDLGNGLRRMAQARGADGADALAGWLLDGAWSQDKADLCARHLTVGETYFFREPRGFDLLCDYARVRLAADPRASLRLWSAGCCTGEEPYSMAMALRQTLPRLAPAQVSILGTDLNPASLAHARAGVYREWSFRRTDPALKQRFFARAGDGLHALAPAIRDQVRFAQLNLALPVYPSAANGTAGIDIIFCRNVLMYFSRALAAQVIARLRACLVDGGWLVVNPSESCAELFAGFSATYFPDAVLYQKTTVAPKRPVAPLPAPLAAAPTPARAPAAPRALPPPGPVPTPAAGAPRAAPETALAQAEALVRAGQREAALHCLARAANQWPLAPQLPRAAAQLALDAGAPGAARGHLQRLLYLEPDSIIGHYLDGIVQLGLGRRAQARRAFMTAGTLLAALADDAEVGGADGWRAGALRASVGAWLERSA